MSSDKGSLKRELGFVDLVTFGVVLMAPISAFLMFGFVEAYSHDGVVASFVVAAIALAFTAVSYGAMAEAAPQVGSGFTYAKIAFGPAIGFLTGWAVLLDYILLPALVTLYAAVFLNLALPAIPSSAWLACFLLLSMTVNLLGIRWSLSVDMTIGGIQFLFAAVFVVMAVAVLAGGALPPAAIFPVIAPTSLVLSGASVAVIAYLGFDEVVTLSEEVKDAHPGRTAGRAAVVCILVLMLINVLVAWLLETLGTGLSFPDPNQSGFVVIAARLPALVWPFTLVAALAMGIGGLVSMHAGVSRVIYSMAREGHLPAVLSRVHPKTQGPWVATVLTGITIATIAYVALPQIDILGQLVSFGALLAFLMVNASVVMHYGIRQGSRNILRHWLMPVVGLVIVAYVLINIRPMALILGAAWLIVGAAVMGAMRTALRAKRIASS